MIMEGWDVKEITALFLDFHVQVIRPLICKEVVEMIKKHAKDGDEVVLASASLDLIIKNIADDLDGLRFIATLLEVKNGKYTGKVDGLISYGENKLILVKKMMTDRGLSWTGSWAYTDDASDLPLLKAVDHPAVINPHQRLRDIAKQEAWPIYDL
jgi:HAD superfamily hydrolase (TIGR01490 family)